MECIHKDNFCRICGCGILTPTKRYDMRINTQLRNSFCQYFETEFYGDLWFAPDYSCSTCARTLYGWVKHEPWKQFAFKVPMKWSEPSFHYDEFCYFCSIHRRGFSSTDRTKMGYKYNTFAIPPILREQEDKIPVYHEKGNDENNENDEWMDVDQNIQVFGEMAHEIEIFDGMPIHEPAPSGDSSRRTTATTATVASECTDTFPPLIPVKKRRFLTAQDINDIGKNSEYEYIISLIQ